MTNDTEYSNFTAQCAAVDPKRLLDLAEVAGNYEATILAVSAEINYGPATGLSSDQRLKLRNCIAGRLGALRARAVYEGRAWVF